jgi:prolyl-tRNA synthetase
MGGNLSHEFHLISDVGEDKILICNDCQFGFNQEIQLAEQEKQQAVNTGSSTEVAVSPRSKKTTCIQCGSSNLSKSNAIEVSSHSILRKVKHAAHIFILFRSRTHFYLVQNTPSPSKLPLLQPKCHRHQCFTWGATGLA